MKSLKVLGLIVVLSLGAPQAEAVSTLSARENFLSTMVASIINRVKQYPKTALCITAVTAVTAVCVAVRGVQTRLKRLRRETRVKLSNQMEARQRFEKERASVRDSLIGDIKKQQQEKQNKAQEFEQRKRLIERRLFWHEQVKSKQKFEQDKQTFEQNIILKAQQNYEQKRNELKKITQETKKQERKDKNVLKRSKKENKVKTNKKVKNN